MRLSYDEDLVESVVFLCANGRCANLSALQVRRFNLQREKLYSILDPDERNEAFFRLHLEWFREWGREELLIQFLKEFSLLPDALELLVFRRGPARGASSIRMGRRPAPAMLRAAARVHARVVALRAERWLSLMWLLDFYLGECFQFVRACPDQYSGSISTLGAWARLMPALR